MNYIRQSKWMGALIGLSLVAGAWSSVADPPRAWLASDLIGMKVMSQTGESVGEIDDIVVHPGGETSYAVLSFGGWLGMGDKLFAMPWTVLKAIVPDTMKKDSKLSLILPLDKERLKLAPGFDKKSWPITANANWTKDIDAFYLGSTNPNSTKPAGDARRTSVITWRATDLKGANVETTDGKKLGDIKELVIDTNGRVSYVALSVGGFLGIGDRLVAVPWDSLRFSLAGDKGDEKLITLAATEAQLNKAPQFNGDKEHKAEMCTPAWIVHIHKYYSCPPYWEKAGGPISPLGTGE